MIGGLRRRVPLRRFDRLPVRWRLAFASAALTLIILVAFALVVGRLAANRIHDDFDGELVPAADAIAVETRVVFDPGTGIVQAHVPRVLLEYARANGAVVHVVDGHGLLIGKNRKGIAFGRPRPGLSSVHRFRVATTAVPAPAVDPGLGDFPSYVQYARNENAVDSTVDRLWLFLLAGVFGGTVLAMFAGLAVADRAMRPVASLTATARDIAATRDTSKQIPEPVARDEVGELASTLDDMLRSLDAARNEREQALERQREFVADASHELRTPLTSVLANLELLAEQLDPGSESSEMVASALGSSQRMRRLVSDLLLLAQADAGRRSARSTCDLIEIAGNALAEIEPVAGRRKLESDLNGSAPIEANPDEVHRVAVNLLDNAVRHTPEGSTIWLRAGSRGGDAVLEVSDDGPGLPKGMSDQVFDRFVRGIGPSDTASAPPGGAGGTGLGLAIVKAVADSHGGSVSAGSSPSGGARFTVRFPVAKDAPAPSAPPLRTPH